MDLREHIQRIRGALSGGQFLNEASIGTGVVLPILQALNWPVFDPQIVSPEFTVEGRRVDFALCHPKARPAVFVELKQPGKSEGADRQLFEYAFHLGVPLAVLTDGREWHFYLPAGQGHYHERRVYRLDLVDRDVNESAERLSRYLGYAVVCAGTALKSATEDYEGVRRNREIASTLPQAWSKLIDGRDELLLELLSDQVEGLCGFRPDPDTVSSFLSQQLRAAPRAQDTGPSARVSPKQKPLPVAVSPNRVPNPPAGKARSAGFTLCGTRVVTRSAIDTLIQFLRAVAERDPQFLDRFASVPQHGRSRRYVARSPDELYPDREDLARDYTRELVPGWWVGTNYSANQIENILQKACEVAELRLGQEISFDIPHRDRSLSTVAPDKL